MVKATDTKSTTTTGVGSNNTGVMKQEKWIKSQIQVVNV